MSDFLQRLVVRHYNTNPQVLPNANTYFSAGAELAASEPASESEAPLDAGSVGFDVAVFDTVGKPMQVGSKNLFSDSAEAGHQTSSLDVVPSDMDTRLHREVSRQSMVRSAQAVDPMSHRRSQAMQPSTIAVQHAVLAPGLDVSRTEFPAVATADRSHTVVTQNRVLSDAIGDSATIVDEPVISTSPIFAIVSRQDLNNSKADTDGAVAVLQATAISRHAVPLRVPEQVITSSQPVGSVAHGLRTSSQAESKTVNLATTDKVEPKGANRAEHWADIGQSPSARYPTAFNPDSAQQEFAVPIAAVASRGHAGSIAPVTIAARSIGSPPESIPSVTISIGSIEVRAAAPPHTPVMQPAPAVSSPRLSLDEYLRRRNGGAT